MAEILLRPSPGVRGRRRTFENDQAFRIITRLLVDSGIQSVTLPAIADGLGVTHQSVSRRFISKQQLLERYADWIGDLFLKETRAIAERHTSPLEVLKDILVLPMPASAIEGQSVRYATWLVLALELPREPAIAPLMTQSMGETRRMFANLVREAQARHELIAAEPERIAGALLSATIGAALLWTIDPIGSFPDAITEQRDLALAPFIS